MQAQLETSGPTPAGSPGWHSSPPHSTVAATDPKPAPAPAPATQHCQHMHGVEGCTTSTPISTHVGVLSRHSSPQRVHVHAHMTPSSPRTQDGHQQPDFASACAEHLTQADAARQPAAWQRAGRRPVVHGNKGPHGHPAETASSRQPEVSGLPEPPADHQQQPQQQQDQQPREVQEAAAKNQEQLAEAATLHQPHAGPPTLAADAALPARLAAQQLASLAGESLKAHQALLRSHRLFERQAQLVELAVLARAFLAWRHLCTCLAHRRLSVLTARLVVEKGQLRSCLHAWRLVCGRHEARETLLHKAHVLLGRGLLQRCWLEWRRQCGLRWWKVQLEGRDQQLQLLAAQLRHIASRPVLYMARKRLRRWLAAWQQEVAYQAGKRAAWSAARQRAGRATLLAAFAGWRAVTEEKAATRRQLIRASRRSGRTKLRQCLASWRAACLSCWAWRERKAAAERWRCVRMTERSVRGWRYITWFKCTATLAQQCQQSRSIRAALVAWRQCAAVQAALAALLAGLAQARAGRLLACTYEAWLAGVEGARSRRQAEELNQLSAEAQHLRRENERLCRVIDSGDWGRHRVEELVQAGRVLQQERDGLARLVAQLPQAAAGGGAEAGLDTRTAPAAAATSKGQVDGLQSRGHRAVVQQLAQPGQQRRHSGPGPRRPAGMTCSQLARPRPPLPAAPHNTLPVQCGPSLSALVRALKQDLLAGGALPGSPAAVLEGDKVSLNHVPIATNVDGSVNLEVQPLSGPDRQRMACSSRYLSPARAMAHSGIDARCQPAAAAPSSHPCRQNSSTLLAAALKLQGTWRQGREPP